MPYDAAMEYDADLVMFKAYQTTESGRVRKQNNPILNQE